MREISYLEAIREALAEEMRRDPKVFILGEDVGEYGGAFGVTQGIFDEFGDERCLDTPISESAIVGVSIGASQRGYRPVAALQCADATADRRRLRDVRPHTTRPPAARRTAVWVTARPPTLLPSLPRPHSARHSHHL